MDALLWSILLLIVGIALIVLEMFIPSGGILGFLAVVAVVGSIIVAFTGGPLIGVVVLLVASVVVPAIVLLAIKWWPRTPLGRRILIPPPENEDDVLPDNEQYRGLKELVGKVGEARSKMLPAGSIRLDGRTYDAISEGMPIDRGQPVRIVAVRTNRLVVRPAEPQQAPAETDTGSDTDEILSQPLDSLGLDPLDDPLA